KYGRRLRALKPERSHAGCTMRKLSALTALCFILAAGCGEAVEEDRGADWGRDGNSLAFQHGEEGVFVADRECQSLTRIFEPDETVLATGRPIHSPIDGRLIFTTAHDPNGLTRSQLAGLLPDSPEGRLFFQQPVRYTCWLRDDGAGGEAPPPKA